ncbi:MAG: PilZ domain-containing protein [Chloroflexi bacterium]|nr:PilZ domain-containing protein [Chloroflexota bacterium]
MSDQDRRQRKRVEMNLLACFRVRDGKETATGFARTRNLSATGVMIESSDSFELEQFVTLDFLMNDNRVLKLRGSVTHLTRTDDGLNLVGIIFENLSTEAKRLLAQQIEA